MHLPWYNKINTIAKDNNARLIDLANYNNYDKTMFHTCDGHWNKKGNKLKYVLIHTFFLLLYSQVFSQNTQLISFSKSKKLLIKLYKDNPATL